MDTESLKPRMSADELLEFKAKVFSQHTGWVAPHKLENPAGPLRGSWRDFTEKYSAVLEAAACVMEREIAKKEPT